MTFNNKQETMASLFLSEHIRWPNEHLKTKNVKELCKQFNIIYDSVLFIHGQIGRRSRWQWNIMIPLGHTIASQQWNPVVIAIVTSSVTLNFRYITPMTLKMRHLGRQSGMRTGTEHGTNIGFCGTNMSTHFTFLVMAKLYSLLMN